MDNFKWTDELVAEYANYCRQQHCFGKKTLIELFKESKQKPEWEILSFYYQTDKRNIATKASNGYYFHFDVSIGNQEQMLQSVWKINSVKRLK